MNIQILQGVILACQIGSTPTYQIECRKELIRCIESISLSINDVQALSQCLMKMQPKTY